MMGTQYFNRREKDALVLTAPTWGPQPTAVIQASFHSSLKRTRLSEFPRLWAPDVRRLLYSASTGTGGCWRRTTRPLWLWPGCQPPLSEPSHGAASWWARHRLTDVLWVEAGSGVFGCGVPSTQSVPADAINSPPHTHSDEGQKELSAVGILPPTFWKETGKAVVAPTVNTEVWPGTPRTVTVCGISYDDLRTLELKKCRSFRIINFWPQQGISKWSQLKIIFGAS